MYRKEIEHQYVHGIEWIFFNIKVPKDNLTSTLAVENIFAQLHSLHSGLTFAQIYVEGRVQLWYSLELVSMGGKISFIIRLPKQTKDLVQASFYAQYPNAEITEVADYMENIQFDPDTTTDFDIWGTEWKLEENFTLPLKTYRDFEHPASEEKIIDPLQAHFESLSIMQPHEFYGVQIIIQTIADNDWKPASERKAKELTGEEIPHHKSFVDILLTPLDWFASLGHGGHGHDHGHDENKPRNNWMSMTDVEKERVTLVQRKMGKPGYKTKIRHLYIAPKDKFDPAKKGIIIGSYRFLGSTLTNKLRPDVSNTWTGGEYVFSPTLEKPYLDYKIKKRKRFIFKGYKNRDIHLGLPMFVLNTEELATLYHFPITSELRQILASVEKTESKKTQPPTNLPISNF